MMRYAVSLFLAAALIATTVPARALQVVYPADRTYVDQSNYLIIKGGTDPFLDGMTIEINGAESDLLDISSPQYRNAFGDFLILQPIWDPGKNSIRIEGYVQGEVVARADAEIFYLDSPDALPPDDYEPFVMHLPEREALCRDCHVMDPSEEQLHSGNPASHPCASCHARMLTKSYVHGPAGVYECVYCHDPGSRPAKYEARAANAELCNECHFDKLEQFQEQEFVHGPVGVGLCSVCHEVHASEFPAQLREFTNDLCLRCHADVKTNSHVSQGIGSKAHPLQGVPDPLSPGRDLTCASCHDPHGGKSAYFFPRGITGRFSLCQLCHQK